MESGQRPQREILRVPIISEVKDSWKTRCGEPGVLPQAVLILGIQEVDDTATHFLAVCLSRGHQSKDRPGRLERRARFELACLLRPEVSVVTFTPTAILALHGFQPMCSAADSKMSRIYAREAESFQHRPGAINVIASPAPEPGAAGFLLIEQVSQASVHGVLVSGFT